MLKRTPFPGLTGNQLKILAMIAMTVDHIGVVLFPRQILFRIIGRLAMPIYAYMIAEGCRHTRDRKKYFLRLFTLGLLCQVVYFFAMGSLFQCILITFSLSVLLIFAIEWGQNRGIKGALVYSGAFFLVQFLSAGLPRVLSGTDYAVDYGFWGVMLPVIIWLGKTRGQRTFMLTWGLVMLALDLGHVQWWSLLTVPILFLYNGQRGQWRIGRLFYFYYPIHLAVIYGLGILLQNVA